MDKLKRKALLPEFLTAMASNLLLENCFLDKKRNFIHSTALSREAESDFWWIKTSDSLSLEALRCKTCVENWS